MRALLSLGQPSGPNTCGVYISESSHCSPVITVLSIETWARVIGKTTKSDFPHVHFNSSHAKETKGLPLAFHSLLGEQDLPKHGRPYSHAIDSIGDQTTWFTMSTFENAQFSLAGK
jgi:hypothetical protein